MRNKIRPLLFLFVLSILICAGCSKANAKISKSGFYFDTIITLTLYGTTDESYIDECFSMAKKYEGLFSNTIASSDISKINARKGEFVEVSEETIDLLNRGIAASEKSQGCFDITIGALSSLWNISEIAVQTKTDDNSTDASVLPSHEEIQEALSHVDVHAIEIEGNRVRLLDAKAQIDVGGIEKGYIADRMKEYLVQQGVSSGIINLGGNILTIGEKKDGAAYSIGIQKPFDEQGESIAILKIKDASVVSSGIYERFYRVDGKLYHHILNLQTGYPVENELHGVTIVSSSSTDGDAFSTICFALGLERGLAWIESLPDTEAVFITEDGKLHTTSGIGTKIEFVVL